ncbi:MAG TPA: hypothetical protein VK348_01320, partial [Planctomycetota bacterium]|nr:hypothetical protein [Planctomycetota bacterium]
MRRGNTGSESGSILIAVMFLIFLMAGMAGAMMIRSNSSTQATSRNNTETQLLMTAESGLNLNAVRMGTDPLYAVKDTVKFTVDATKKEYVGPVESVSMPGAVKRTFTMRLQYLCTGVPVVFANRANPKDSWTNLKVSVSAQAAGLSREVAGWYRYEMGPEYSAAIISDTLTSGASVGGGEPQAQAGDIVIDDKGTPGQQFVFGGIKANGSVWHDGSGGLKAMTTAAAPSELGGFTGEVDSRLGGTAAQIPDFTDPGTST